MHLLRLAIAGMLAAALAAGQEDPVLDGLIKKLGAAELEEREAAGRALLARGQAAHAALEQARRNADPEIAARAADILAAMDRDIDSLSVLFQRIQKEHSDSWQKVLWRSTRTLEEACKGREWSAITESFKRQGIELACGTGEGSRFLAKKDFWISAAGIHHDFVLNFTTSLRISREHPTKIAHDTSIAGIHSEPRIDMAGIRAKPYPAGTLLWLLFEHPELKKAVELFPIIDELSVLYGILYEPLGVLHTRGFQVCIRLTNRERSEGQTLSFDAASGLDPVMKAGVRELPADFVSSDSLKPLVWRGNSNWPLTAPKASLRLRAVDGEGAGKPPIDAPSRVVYSSGDLKVLPGETTGILIKGEAFDEEDAKSLARLPKIRTLLTEYAENVSDTALASIARLPGLEKLALSSTNITDNGIAHLAGHPRLNDLTLDWCEFITDAGAADLARIKGLNRLTLRWIAALTDEGVKHLAGLAGLKELQLWGGLEVGDPDLEALAPLKNLERLTLSHFRDITAADLEWLPKLPSLREINLGYLSVDDKALAALAMCPCLEVVTLTKMENVTDAGLAGFKSLKKLKDLHITECEGITREGMQALQSTLPGKYRLE